MNMARASVTAVPLPNTRQPPPFSSIARTTPMTAMTSRDKTSGADLPKSEKVTDNG
jgi:hypothetical protein